MTPQQIDALPAGRELDARVLVHVCGWKWRVTNALKLWQLVPPPNEPNRWEPTMMCEPKKDAELFSYPEDHWPEMSERFSDWDCSCVQRHPNKHNFRIGAPRVSTDIAAAWTVVEAMKDKGYSVTIWDCPEVSSVPSPGVMMKRGVHPPQRYSEDESVPLAMFGELPACIARCALKAVFAAKAQEEQCKT